MISEREFSFVSDALRIEGMLHEGDAPLLAVVLHPHPQYGGDMDNYVVLAVRQALASLGATTLRFNFRGVGRSGGAYDSGRGEANDARAAVEALRAVRPDARLVLAGYSFGAAIAAVASDCSPDALIFVSPPRGTGPYDRLPDVPALFITGELDAVAPPDALPGDPSPMLKQVVVGGADHFWMSSLDALVENVEEFVRLTVMAQPGGGVRP